MITPDFEVSLKLKPGVQPVYAKVRPVPYALLARDDQETNRLEEAGIIERVEYSSWGTPVVPWVFGRNLMA
jgi:hypothetical protein